MARLLLDMQGFSALLTELARRGYRVVGPTVRDAAVVLDDVEGVDNLPRGVGDEQDGGRYRLRARGDDALFGFSVGPMSLRRFMKPPRRRVFSAERGARGGLRIIEDEPAARRTAFIGVRACDLAALAVQDAVFVGAGAHDPAYAAARSDVFLVAVQCGQAGGTCFCASMGTGPRATAGFDLALTELGIEHVERAAGAPARAGAHRFVVEAGSDAGRDVLAALSPPEAAPADVADADAVVEETARHMGRRLDTAGIQALFADNREHPRWDQVADRCLSCANCTLVCPTCFCSTVEDTSDVTGEHAERWERWDSCFNADFSHLHGGPVRATTRGRYRQWISHKLGTWHEQFGTSGCVGCGRCVTWCPVGIDITEETAALRGDGSDHG